MLPRSLGKTTHWSESEIDKRSEQLIPISSYYKPFVRMQEVHIFSER
jgi:hypothetical protein